MPFAPLHPSTRRLGVVFALMMLAALVRSSGPTTTNELAAALRPARNPERLHLLLDARRVFGWIGGTKKHAVEAEDFSSLDAVGACAVNQLRIYGK